MGVFAVCQRPPGNSQVTGLRGKGRQCSRNSSSRIGLRRVGAQLAVTKQMGEVLADVLGTELVGRPVEMTREVRDGPQVSAYGSLAVITTLEFRSIIFRTRVTGTSL